MQKATPSKGSLRRIIRTDMQKNTRRRRGAISVLTERMVSGQRYASGRDRADGFPFLPAKDFYRDE
jgi:indole-3-glycerol phosphate synthase